MAKRKRTPRTPEEQQAYDERSRWVDEQLESRWQALEERHGISDRMDAYAARTKVLEERIAQLNRQVNERRDNNAQA